MSVLSVVIVACGGSVPGPAPPDASGARWFTDVTESWGLGSPAPPVPGRYRVPEVTAAGLAVFDADGDGDLDLWQRRVPHPDAPDDPAPDVLWRQTAPGRFERWPDRGMEDPGYAQAAALGDPDGDGDLDLYAGNLGRDRYYENLGGGRFVDATERVGLGDDGWSSAAAFCDLDADGDQDLWVVRYLDYDPDRQCLADAGGEDYCGPAQFRGAADRFYENVEGRFVSRGGPLDLERPDVARGAKGLGVVCTDLTGDGRPDVYVANDGEPNHLWVRSPSDDVYGAGGRWREVAMGQGVAVNRHGSPESSMGIALADLEPDGRFDLFLTHLSGQNNTRYRFGGMAWDDATALAGWSADDWPRTGFGCALADFDADGDDDLAVANGRVFRDPAGAPAGSDPFWGAYAEPDLLFENVDGGRFVTREGSALAGTRELSRGMIAADLDADGDLDLAVSNHDGSLRVYRNDRVEGASPWILRLRDAGVPALGATVETRGPGGVRLDAVLATRSYASAGPPDVVVYGIGGSRPTQATVTWTDGAKETYELGDPGPVVLRRGEGMLEAPGP